MPPASFRAQNSSPGGATEEMRETVLDNGIHVLSEHIPGVRSVSTGVWVRHGAAHEEPEEHGACHLLEHMVFKGTRRRTARKLALALESLGGSLDAYTSREHTSFQARVLDAHLPEALDVLADLVREPLLRDEDLELEREVVLEEIAQVEDTPDDLVFELHARELWGGHAYGRSILGTAASVSSMRGDTLRGLHARRYRGRNLVVAAAGNVDHDDLVSRVREHFGTLEEGDEPATVTLPPASGVVGERAVDRASQQVHLVFGALGPRRTDDDRYPLVLLSSALGGGMSSRLFQRVREELGLCYSVYTFQSFYREAGAAGLYVGTRPATVEPAQEAVREELERIAGRGLPPAELAQSKQQLKGQVMLSLESTSARMYRLSSFALYDEPFRTLDDLLQLLDGVTEEDVAGVSERCFDPARQLVLKLGPI